VIPINFEVGDFVVFIEAKDKNMVTVELQTFAG
jgi:hypothetical protein